MTENIALTNDNNIETADFRTLAHTYYDKWLKAAIANDADRVIEGGYMPVDEVITPDVAKNADLNETSVTNIDDISDDSPEVSLAASANAKMTDEQKKALVLLKSGVNCFLTGSAGTGKSFLLRKFIDSSRSVLVTAPSGVAAVRLGGRTLHSAFGVPLRILAPRECLFSDYSWARFTGSKNYPLIHACDTLIIDEISMVRADVFKWVVNVLRAEKEFTGHKIQLVCCGDFFQLPPVIKNEEQEAWNTVYPNNPEGYAFLTEEWESLDIKMIELTQIVRQRSQKYAAALNLIRCGDPGNVGRDWILKNTAQKPVQNGICVCGRRQEASRMNQKALEKLDSEMIEVPTVIDGPSDENIEKNMVVEPQLTLKIGARVMTVINDSRGRFQNGSLGTVRDFVFDQDGNMCFVRVNMDDTGLDVDIAPHKWEVKKPVCVEDDGETFIHYSRVSDYYQFPLRLAWACTIHKSQGATYNAANISTKNVWATGQLYVALSRCSDIKRMYIDGKLSDSQVVQSKAVLDFYASEREKNAAQKN